MNEEISSKPNSHTVLILGDLKLDGVTDKIIVLGYAYDTIKFFPDLFNSDAEKALSLKETVMKINQLRTSGRLSTLIIYLTEQVIFDTCDSENNAIWLHLLQEIEQTNSLIFVHEQ